MENSLIIWTKSSGTLKFEKVTHFKTDDLNITFQYYGISTDTTRNAWFNTSEILGWALSTNP